MLRNCPGPNCLGRVTNTISNGTTWPKLSGFHKCVVFKLLHALLRPEICTRTNLNKNHVAKFQDMLQAHFRQ